MHRSLIVAPNWIGDAVMAIPFLRALARERPSGSIAVLAKRGPGAVLGAALGASLGAPEVEIIRRGGLLADARSVRARRFEEAWLLPNSFRSAVAPYLARVPERIGYATDGRGSLLTVRAPAHPATGHQLRDYDSLLRLRGIAPDMEPPRLVLPPAARTRAEAALAAAGLRGSGGDRLILLAPGAAFSWTKRWPPERFGRLAAMLSAAGSTPAFAIGPGEEPLAAKAVAEAPGTPVLGADLDPVELAALFSYARAVVANDSGPMHLAAAVGAPVVAIFGPTDPGRTAPSGSPAGIIDRYVFCSPCFLQECPYRHECMTGIEAEEIAMRLSLLVSNRETDHGPRS